MAHSDEDGRKQDSATGNASRKIDLEYRGGVCFHQPFESQAERRPDAIAVVFEKQHLTYKELNQRSNQLARRLQALGARFETPVGVCMERSFELIVAILGLFKAGATFIPLDPASPASRLRYMLEDSAAPIILTQERFREKLLGSKAEVINLDAQWEAIAQEAPTNLDLEVTDEGLCAVFYTSGSTGNPKGVMTPHRSPVSRLFWSQAIWQIDEHDRCLLQAGISYASTMTQIFMPFLGGGRLVMARPGEEMNSAYLAQLIAEEGITIAGFPPSMLRLFLEEPEQVHNGLRHVYCSAEALPAAIQDLFFDSMDAELHKFYGLTESPGVTYWHCERGEDQGKLSIGRPTDMKAYLLDANLQPVAVGMVGEIYAGGISLTRGYLNRPDLTADRYVPDPFSDSPGARLYRTGDLGRWLPNGAIKFLGRVDDQVNVYGYRVELGEIEMHLNQHPGIREAAALAREDAPGDKRLVAYVVAAPSSRPTTAELRRCLAGKLPEYMIPAVFVFLDRLPRTANGKIDRRALPAPTRRAVEMTDGRSVPRNQIEAMVAEIWSEIFSTDRLSMHDDFFEMGGHSLLAIQLMSRIGVVFQIKMPLRHLLESPTVAGLAQAIETALQKDSRQFAISKTRLQESRGEVLTIARLNAEAILDPAIGSEAAPFEGDNDPACIFMTGATGYLGGFLLHGLLETTRASIYCLVRPRHHEKSHEILHKHLAAYSLWNERFADRIIPVPGDLSQPGLGLPAKQFQAMAERMDVVYHNGAMVNYMYPYRAHKPTNVVGTQEVLRLASQTRLKPVHYVSTLSVFQADGNPDQRLFYECEDLDQTGVPYSGYDQSKWVAEKLLRTAMSRGLPVAIYRPGLILGHSQTGAWHTHDFACTFLKICIQLGSVPDFDVVVSAVPVDYVSQTITQLSAQKESPGNVFHLSNPNPAHGRQLVDWLNTLGYSLELLPYDKWRKALIKAAERFQRDGLEAYFHLMIQADASHFRRREFDCRNALAGLAGSSIACPPLGPELLETYVSYLLRCGFLETPPRRG